MPGTNPAVDHYQTITGTGAKDIDLTALTNGAIVPANGDSLFFTVVAVDAANNASTPALNDETSIVWDKAAPATPTGILLTDNLGAPTMHILWDNQSSDPDLKRFDFYVNFNAPATPTQHTYYQEVSKTFYNGTMFIGVGNDLEGVQNGNEVYVSVYAVDKYGNTSPAAEAHATYSLSN
ncbi:hypothetical protein EDM56_00575 [Brevibacillus fluminis]|uniref:Uncharacterized protein n=1 Tax=Brevibacillus fluminis TaxID=511487 RepID=A0A3M8DXM0_9BACL|nr:hypothetical protein [Brevibacillus fluminis]RNB92674.1 hypothetical protein EDM56_00575 [Brevibacillus fluminis]